jgi:hypothetical protein
MVGRLPRPCRALCDRTGLLNSWYGAAQESDARPTGEKSRLRSKPQLTGEETAQACAMASLEKRRN